MPHLVTAGCGVRDPGRLAADFLQPPDGARIAALGSRERAERGQAGDSQGASELISRTCWLGRQISSASLAVMWNECLVPRTLSQMILR